VYVKKNIPIEQVEIKEGNIVAFAWEPKGNRFAIIHGEGSRPDVSFYTMDKQLRLLKTLEKRAINSLYWSPQGEFIVLAGLGNLNGTLEFFYVNEMELIGHEDHFNCSAIEWDPTGRYISSVVSFWKHQVETGYNIYSFQGKLLKHVLKDKFYQMIWRPRPASLLSQEKRQSIKANIKKYFQQFREADDKTKKIADRERFNKREAMRLNFEKIFSTTKQSL